jgi:hypothetical protein
VNTEEDQQSSRPSLERRLIGLAFLALLGYFVYDYLRLQHCNDVFRERDRGLMQCRSSLMGCSPSEVARVDSLLGIEKCTANPPLWYVRALLTP